MQVIPLTYQRKSLKNNSKKPMRVVYSSVFRLLKYFFYLLGSGAVGGFKEVTILSVVVLVLACPALSFTVTIGTPAAICIVIFVCLRL